jgi:hypothetical protein
MGKKAKSDPDPAAEGTTPAEPDAITAEVAADFEDAKTAFERLLAALPAIPLANRMKRAVAVGGIVDQLAKQAAGAEKDRPADPGPTLFQ